MKRAFLIVDPQNDFCPGGALAVTDGDKIMAPLNRAMETTDLPVFVSRDWHPAKSAHFKTWPVHCVEGTEGAAFHTDLRIPENARIISKGMDPDDDGGYSAFDGVDLTTKQDLGELLTEQSIEHLFVAGLATDYCVKASVLDAIRGGLKVTVLADAIGGVEVERGDIAFAVATMANAGAEVLKTEQALKLYGYVPAEVG